MKRFSRIAVSGAGALWPFAVYAVTFDNPLIQPGKLLAVICKVRNGIFPLFLAIGVLGFLVAAALYFFAGGDAAKTGNAKKALTAAIVGIGLAMLSFGLPAIIAAAFGVPDTALPAACI